MVLPNRHSIRLKNYDYASEGAYFVTICSQNREFLFGNIVDGKMILNQMGKIVDLVIRQTPEIRKNVVIDVFQIMPNHVHIIVMIMDRFHGVGAYCNTPLRMGLKSPSQTLGAIIRGIKSVTTKQIHILMNNPEFPVWQRNYYEHIIRNEKDFDKISWYILNNPLLWDKDTNNPNIVKSGEEFI